MYFTYLRKMHPQTHTLRERERERERERWIYIPKKGYGETKRERK